MNQNPSIITFSGQVFNYSASILRIYHIEDIAQGLSNLCRFTGQCNRFYSVAEHSILVSRYLPLELKLAGLLHDASEAFLGDVNSPLKSLLPQYKELEQKIQQEIASRYSLPYPFPQEIHDADYEIFCQEWQELMLGKSLYVPKKDVKNIRGHFPITAKTLFLQEYKKLTKDKKGSQR